jgi:RHS repeat-associated protein
MRTVILSNGGPYPYGGTGNANPDAVTQIATGYSTTTFQFDQDGNVTQKTVDGTTTTYLYDYANRLITIGSQGATTTYGYDWAGNRASQTGTTTTYLYPFKWYSVASSTGSGAKYATTTDYMFNGDTLLATVDQQTASGNATGTAKTRYVHPDHLGSTNVVTDENGNVAETLDYFPYGATRISVGTSTRERRQFIGQFTDDSTLNYLNARYYDANRGQFSTEDPTFLAVGDPSRLQQLTQKQQQELLRDPQTLNAYGYARDNPITNKDATGLISQSEIDLLFKAVNGISGAEAAKSYYEANYSDETNPQVEAHAQAQSYYDAGTFAPSFAVTYDLVNADPVTGFLIDEISL